MQDLYEEAKCPEHKEVNCMLAKNYPYCDMTCPINEYAQQAYTKNLERSLNYNVPRYPDNH